MAHLQGGVGQRLGAHEPLVPDKRLHDVAAPLRARHAHAVRVLADGKAGLLRSTRALCQLSKQRPGMHVPRLQGLPPVCS